MSWLNRRDFLSAAGAAGRLAQTSWAEAPKSRLHKAMLGVSSAALAEIVYNGWMSIEDGDLSPNEHSRRLDLILAGK